MSKSPFEEAADKVFKHDAFDSQRCRYYTEGVIQKISPTAEDDLLAKTFDPDDITRRRRDLHVMRSHHIHTKPEALLDMADDLICAARHIMLGKPLSVHLETLRQVSRNLDQLAGNMTHTINVAVEYHPREKSERDAIKAMAEEMDRKRKKK